MAAGTLNTIQEILRRDAGVGGDADRLEQISWMLFLKTLDDLEIWRESAHEHHRSPIPDDLRWRTWAVRDRLGADDLISFVDDLLLPALKSLPEVTPLSRTVRQVFSETRNYMRSGELLRRAVDALNETDLAHLVTRQSLAESYEHLLASSVNSGLLGEYYTPRALTRLVVELTDPRPGETILDPVCGTGGFLVDAVEHLRSRREEGGIDERDLQASILGIEKQFFPYLLCVTDLLLHGVVATILRENALLRTASDTFHAGPDVVLANPPFGGMEAGSVGAQVPREFRTRETTDLVLYYIMEALRPGGRAAVLVPDGALSGEGARARLRRRLLEECDLHTIVRLPRGVFSPYTSIETNLLFFTRGKPTTETWVYEHPYPAGQKGYSKTRPLRIEEFDALRTWWGARRETTSAWRAPIRELVARGDNLHFRRANRSAGLGPSRLAWLKLRGLRGFASLVLELPSEGPAVLVGVNGAGKSTVLDAIAMHLSAFTAMARGLPAQKAEVVLGEADIKTGEKSASVELMLRIGGDEQVWELRATRSRKNAVSKEIAAQAAALHEGLERAEDASLPVLCHYPATRGLGDGEAHTKRPAQRHRLYEMYERAFGRGFGPFHDFVQWFREEEDAENEGRLRIDPRYKNPRLDVVRRALERFLAELGDGHFSNLRMDRLGAGETPRPTGKPAELVLDKDGVRLAVQQFSEGERNTILLVADLARRLAIANPSLEDPLRGEGIVLIDEIDLHLHPAWQRGIVPALTATFPKCQVIVTTHSPQALSRIPRENVFILEGFDLVRVTPHTYGHDANSILGEVMGVPERPREITEKIRRTSVLIDEERLDEAKAALEELTSLLGDQDHMVVRLRTLMSFLGDGG